MHIYIQQTTVLPCNFQAHDNDKHYVQHPQLQQRNPIPMPAFRLPLQYHMLVLALCSGPPAANFCSKLSATDVGVPSGHVLHMRMDIMIELLGSR